MKTRLSAGRIASTITNVQPRPSNQMTISVSLKIAPTPPGFPRRAGVAKKRPLA